jgi:hypothetical protein
MTGGEERECDMSEEDRRVRDESSSASAAAPVSIRGHSRRM